MYEQYRHMKIEFEINTPKIANAIITILNVYDFRYNRYRRYHHDRNSTIHINAILVGTNLVSVFDHFVINIPIVKITHKRRNGNGIIFSELLELLPEP